MVSRDSDGGRHVTQGYLESRPASRRRASMSRFFAPPRVLEANDRSLSCPDSPCMHGVIGPDATKQPRSGLVEPHLRHLVRIMRTSMRRAWIRILIATLVGVYSSVCCCRMVAFTGHACPGLSPVKAEPRSCCDSCGCKPEAGEEASSPSDDMPRPGECPDCPSCSGRVDALGLKVEPAGVALPSHPHPVAEIAWPSPASSSREARGGLARSPARQGRPPHARFNRDLQRWHCALTV